MKTAENLLRNRLSEKEAGNHPQLDSIREKNKIKAHYFSLRIFDIY